MSLQVEGLLGNGTLILPAPVFRSKANSALTPSGVPTAIPRADRSFEHTHKRPAFSSTRTPKVEWVPKVPGSIHTFASDECGSIRVIPPLARLLTYRVPSLLEEILSGKARSPGRATDSMSAAVASKVTASAMIKGKRRC